MRKILIIEDNPKLSKLLKNDLSLEGYQVECEPNGLKGHDLAKSLKPDLLILDVMLPDLNGYEICRLLRKEGFDKPILMLTAKGEETDKVTGLQLGADDYVTKPFGALELLARVQALLRRDERQKKDVEEYKWKDISVNFKKMEAKKGSKNIPLTTKEFQILHLLVKNTGNVVSRQQFLNEIWKTDAEPSTRTIDNQLLSLRKKLFESPEKAPIQTIYGAGYKLTE